MSQAYVRRRAGNESVEVAFDGVIVDVDPAFELFAPCLEDDLAALVDLCTSVSLAGRALEADAGAGSHTCSKAGGCARVSC